jgi:phage terminase small subunit
MNYEDTNQKIADSKELGYPDLSDAQKQFCMAYVESYTIKRAAKEAGVSSSKASRWLRDPLVLEFIADLQAVLNNRSVISKDFVTIQWLKLMPKLMGEEEVPMIHKGIAFEEKKFHSNEAVSLLKEISKATNFYGDQSMDTDEDSPSLNINVTVADPVSDVKITRGKADA